MQKENNQTVLERKQQMGHLITRCPAFILLERSVWGCSLAPEGTIRRYRALKWLKIFSLLQTFLPPVDDSRNKHNKTSTATMAKNTSTGAITLSMNVDEHLSGFFVKNYLEPFCDATNLSARLFLFHCSDYDFR